MRERSVASAAARTSRVSPPTESWFTTGGPPKWSSRGGPVRREGSLAVRSGASPHRCRACRARPVASRLGRLVKEVSTTLIDRRFREKIVLVGMVAWPRTVEEVEATSMSCPCSSTPQVPTRQPALCNAAMPRTRRPTSAGARQRASQDQRGVDADTVVFDDELTPAQQRNLERILAGPRSTGPL